MTLSRFCHQALFGAWVCLAAASCQAPHSTTPDALAVSEPALRLVWADEFDTEGLPDSSRWAYDVGDGCPQLCGWGNAEQQYYTEARPANARVEGGQLIIEAHREPYAGREYSSARLVSRGKGDWRYGRIEVRAKLPQGRGTWPAIWMLPSNRQYGGWPHSGEIDIMEHVGFEPDSIYGTVHTGAFNHINGTQRGGRIYWPSSEADFHTYVLDWTATGMDFLVDGELYFRFANDGSGPESWPFDQPFHLILNLAVGGHWGGRQGVDEGIWPQRMLVDYVRVYQAEEPAQAARSKAQGR